VVASVMSAAVVEGAAVVDGASVVVADGAVLTTGVVVVDAKLEPPPLPEQPTAAKATTTEATAVMLRRIEKTVAGRSCTRLATP
jgi:hypothetical protein